MAAYWVAGWVERKDASLVCSKAEWTAWMWVVDLAGKMVVRPAEH